MVQSLISTYYVKLDYSLKMTKSMGGNESTLNMS